MIRSAGVRTLIRMLEGRPSFLRALGVVSSENRFRPPPVNTSTPYSGAL